MALFGGAMSCTVRKAINVADLQEVPDNQEVLAFANSRSCLIVELLELVEEKEGEEAARHFFEDICAANGGGEEAATVELVQELDSALMPNLAVAYPKQVLVGRQVVAKARRSDVVRVLMVHVRLPEVSTDLLLSLSSPIAEADTPEDELPAFPVNAFQDAEVRSEMTDLQLLLTVLESFTIDDYSLFG